MKCEYCGESIFKHNSRSGTPITVAGVGIAHLRCAETAVFSKREFKNISLNALSLEELRELKEMLLQELNSRDGNGNAFEFFHEPY